MMTADLREALNEHFGTLERVERFGRLVSVRFATPLSSRGRWGCQYFFVPAHVDSTRSPFVRCVSGSPNCYLRVRVRDQTEITILAFNFWIGLCIGVDFSMALVFTLVVELPCANLAKRVLSCQTMERLNPRDSDALLLIHSEPSLTMYGSTSVR